MKNNLKFKTKEEKLEKEGKEEFQKRETWTNWKT